MSATISLASSEENYLKGVEDVIHRFSKALESGEINSLDEDDVVGLDRLWRECYNNCIKVILWYFQLDGHLGEESTFEGSSLVRLNEFLEQVTNMEELSKSGDTVTVEADNLLPLRVELYNYVVPNFVKNSTLPARKDEIANCNAFRTFFEFENLLDLAIKMEYSKFPFDEYFSEETINATPVKRINFSDYRETEDVNVQNLGGDYDTSPGDVFVTGEDSILEKICQTYQISTFEADEILSAHRSFEGSTINLKGTYSIHFIEQTEEFLSTQDRNRGKTGFFGAISKMTTRLATEPRDMWRKYKETRALHRSLVKIIDTYELPKATNERPESIITAIYNIRNEANDISNAQASMEGRRIFDTLRRKEHMLERLDI